MNRKAAVRAASGHPWIFSSDVVDTGLATGGEAVEVVDLRGRPLGVAHYSSSSQIALRLLSDRATGAGPEFFEQRFRTALEFRRRIVPAGTNAYRLVHAEGDLLPALIVDYYAGYLAVQTLNQGMDASKPIILRCLEDLIQPAGIVERNDVPVRQRESLPLISGVLAGSVPERVEVQLNGFRFYAGLLTGQKTGVYLDQRENYLAAARYAGGRALDCFTSTGGFALHLASGCQSVEAVDSSAAALDMARSNADANQIGNIEFKEANAFDLLNAYARARSRFDLVVLDPPAFTKAREGIAGAARGYKEINLRALQLLERGGILITCSCSHHFSEALLLETVAAAALDAGRTLRVLERRTQASDHPILLTVPETHYLKCVIFEVL